MHFALKSWFHHIHFPTRRDAVIRAKSFFYREGFWAFIAIMLILATLALIIYWGGSSLVPMYPSPYMYY